MQRDLVHVDSHDGCVQLVRRTVLRDKRQDLRLGLFLNGFGPIVLLGTVDLAEIQNVRLHDPVSGQSAVLDDTPIDVSLAVLFAI